MPSLPGEAGRCRARRGGRPVAVKVGLLQFTFGDSVSGSEIGRRTSKESGLDKSMSEFHFTAPAR